MWLVTKLYSESVHGIFGITTDNSLNVYFTTRNKELLKLSSEGAPPQCLLKNKSIIRELVWNRNNDLFICDWSGHKILRYDLESQQISVLVGTGRATRVDGYFDIASFCYPWGICMDNNGDLFISEEQSLRKVDLKNRTVQTVFLPLTLLSEMASCGVHDGAVYVCDRRQHQVQIIKNDTLNSLQFTFPRCVAFAKNGLIVVSDAQGLWGFLEGFPYFLILKKSGISSLTARNNSFLVGTASEIYRLDQPWSIQKLLWIGHLKEDASYCQLARLPKELVKEIFSFVRTFHLTAIKEWYSEKDLIGFNQ